MGRRIYVDLTDEEDGNVAGWVNRLRQHPEWVGKTSGDPNAYPPDWQTKIVLVDQSRARFEQIDAQFGGPPVEPPVEPPEPPVGVADPNYGIPAGTFPGISTDTPMHRGDQERVRSIDPQIVYALPLVIPDRPWNQTLLLNMAACDFASPAGSPFMQACFSALPGDFKNALGTSRSEGTSVFSMVNVTAHHLDPGETVYFNIRLWSSDLQRVTTDKPHQVRLGGGWPR